METFEFIGMSLGAIALVYSLSALSKIGELEKRLKDHEVFNNETLGPHENS